MARVLLSALPFVAAVVLPLPVIAADPAPTTTVRFATFNASLNRNAAGDLLSDLGNPGGAGTGDAVARRILQAQNVAQVIQRIAPDVLLVNEFDHDAAGVAGSSSVPNPLGYTSLAHQRFHNNFLATGQGGAAPIAFAHGYTPTTNTGIASGFDLNNNGVVGGGDDAFGFGNFAGQFGMTIYSKYEIVGVRTFQNFLWKDMPNNLLTSDPTANDLEAFYSPEEVDVLRLSSKNHVDVVLNVGGQEVHFLTAHPTPPVFDGAEDRNGKRNHDEIRFWKDYVNGASYIYDDQGGTGGLAADALFVIAGDYNADLQDGDSFRTASFNAIGQLLNDPKVNATMTPEAPGGTEQAALQGGANADDVGDPRYDTADFADTPAGTAAGNLRVDYVLPSSNTTIVDSGVFWPASNDPLFPLVGTFGNPNLFSGFPTSDHRAVWADVAVPVPEPGTWAFMGLGLAVLAGAATRQRAKHPTGA
ncbi:MAG: endonuclease/exonuclease/phosphatase family protein [Burkholderiales bacterium]|nr:endonuclease/exonuclease/phosphatase family protein [Burkholderiales bacterium]